jgi:hypothetical protein
MTQDDHDRIAKKLRYLASEDGHDYAEHQGDASELALDAIAAACGCPTWEYPGQVVRDVEAVVAERDELRGRLNRTVAGDPTIRGLIGSREG